MVELTKEKLKEIYYSNTNKDACKILGISELTLIKYVKKANIEPKGKGGGMVGISSKKISLVS